MVPPLERLLRQTRHWRRIEMIISSARRVVRRSCGSEDGKTQWTINPARAATQATIAIRDKSGSLVASQTKALAAYLETSLDHLKLLKGSRRALRRLIGKLYTSHADGGLSRDARLRRRAAEGEHEQGDRDEAPRGAELDM